MTLFPYFLPSLNFPRRLRPSHPLSLRTFFRPWLLLFVEVSKHCALSLFPFFSLSLDLLLPEGVLWMNALVQSSPGRRPSSHSQYPSLALFGWQSHADPNTATGKPEKTATNIKSLWIADAWPGRVVTWDLWPFWLSVPPLDGILLGMREEREFKKPFFIFCSHGFSLVSFEIRYCNGKWSEAPFLPFFGSPGRNL